MNKTSNKYKEAKKDSVLAENVRWVWKDGNLDCVSMNANLDRSYQGVGFRNKSKPGASFNYINYGRKKQNFLTSNPRKIKRPIHTDKFKYNRNTNLSPRPKRINPGGESNSVTLKDVKRASLDATLDEIGTISATFQRCFETSQLDTFLMCVLHYFASFIEKTEEDKKPTIMENPWQREANLRNTCSTLRKMKFASKSLGQAYCILIMGLGLEDHHHMHAGKSRVSAIFTDRDFFESLYAFTTHVVHITFRRQYFNEVTQEMGRLFRSEMYNVALRKRDKNGDDSDDTEIKKYVDQKIKDLQAKRKELGGGQFLRQTVLPVTIPKVKKTSKKGAASNGDPSLIKEGSIDALMVSVEDLDIQTDIKKKILTENNQSKKDENESVAATPKDATPKRESIALRSCPLKHLPKRPPINSLINARSPAVIALLPSTVEQSPLLMSRAKPYKLEDFKTSPLDEHEEITSDEIAFLESTNVGIIGEPIEKFNKINLMPFVDDGDDSESRLGSSYQNSKIVRATSEESVPRLTSAQPPEESPNDEINVTEEEQRPEEIRD